VFYGPTVSATTVGVSQRGVYVLLRDDECFRRAAPVAVPACAATVPYMHYTSGAAARSIAVDYTTGGYFVSYFVSADIAGIAGMRPPIKGSGHNSVLAIVRYDASHKGVRINAFNIGPNALELTSVTRMRSDQVGGVWVLIRSYYASFNFGLGPLNMAGGDDVVVARLNSEMDAIANRCLGGKQTDYPYDLAVGTVEGGIVVAFTTAQMGAIDNTATPTIMTGQTNGVIVALGPYAHVLAVATFTPNAGSGEAQAARGASSRQRPHSQPQCRS
jgi:hypothetical protein